MTTFPSGEQFEIAHRDLRATVTQVGGSLRTLRAGDWEILDGFPVDTMSHDGRGQLLIPWPNRVAGGTYTFDGKTYQLALSEPAHHAAIHGLVRWAPWSVEELSSGRVRMAYRLFPMSGYPFMLDLSVTYGLSDAGLQVTLRAENAGEEATPFGAGQHPYVRVGTSLVNEAILHIPAETAHRYDENLIPIGRVPVEGTPLDFRTPRPIGDTEINMDYTDVRRDGDGRFHVELAAPDGAPALEVWMDEAFRHVTVYTGETVQPPERRRRSLAVEPMSCPPNAFATGQDLVVLKPGERWEGTWGITVRKG
ncbi:MAG: aldose 1-epimerase family protein [Chloroflexota bacterium]|nr:MAG: aldose epimerase [Chloroflexota bacterium]